MDHISERLEFAVDLCRMAGSVARDYFAKRATLLVDQKGAQDWVSEADRRVETYIREQIESAWPEDGIVGEEHAPKAGSSGFDWVIDPIDGTTNFINGIPTWTVVLAGVMNGRTEIGVIHDPMSNEMFVARRGGGARLNGEPMQVAAGTPLNAGTVAVGYSNRVTADRIVPIVAAVIERGAMFHRNASGALSLAYVADGRLLGYIEEHMNAWDCLAGQLLVSEAGGVIEDVDVQEMIQEGGRVVVGTPDVFAALHEIAEHAWRAP